MRRPLFWAALCLVAVAAVRLDTGGFMNVPKGQISAQSIEDFEELTVAGQVYKKDGGQIYLKDVTICGQISEEYLTDQYLLSQAGDSRQSISCKENIICKIDDAGSISLGSKVVLEGRFVHFSQATNPGEFDAAAYYMTLGVGGRLDRAEVLACGENYWPVREALYDLGAFLRGRLYRALGEREAGVMCALLLGDKDGLEEQVEELYRRNGILHILSISSLHVTILGMSFYGLLRRLGVPVGPAAVAGSILLLLYGGLTGFGVSACRAIGMYLIRMLGEVLGRTYDMLTALGVMAAVMVVSNPYYLQHSGFLLSYSSVLGIGVLYPALFGGPEKAVGGETGKFKLLLQRLRKGLRQSATASLSVTLTTLPVQLWCYYEVPVYAVFLNLLVLPFMKLLMLAGMVVAALPGFLPAAGVIKLILGWYELLCNLFGRLPFHTWNPGCPRLWQIAVYYLILALAVLLRVMWSKYMNGEARLGPAMFVVPALVCAVLILGLRPPMENTAVFLDVGQGDCVLVRTASGENYLFDCGSTSRSNVGEYVLIPYLKYYGIRKLDAVFVSHPDKDHVSGILELLEMGEEGGVEVSQLVLPGIAEKLREEQLGQLVTAAYADEQDSLAEIRWLTAGDSWQVESASFLCLHPKAGSTLEDSNAYSECVYVEFRDSRGKWNQAQPVITMLLTGDVEGEGERALLEELKNRGIRQVDVLKVAHHGSRGTTSQDLLEQIRPVVSVISSGRNNSYGHPHEELLERLDGAGSMIFGTAECGAVTLRFQNGEILLEVFLK